MPNRFARKFHIWHGETLYDSKWCVDSEFAVKLSGATAISTYGPRLELQVSRKTKFGNGALPLAEITVPWLISLFCEMPNFTCRFSDTCEKLIKEIKNHKPLRTNSNTLKNVEHLCRHSATVKNDTLKETNYSFCLSKCHYLRAPYWLTWLKRLSLTCYK